MDPSIKRDSQHNSNAAIITVLHLRLVMFVMDNRAITY